MSSLFDYALRVISVGGKKEQKMLYAIISKRERERKSVNFSL